MFRFRIWNHFANFTNDNNLLVFRASVYNPSYYMPSETTINIYVNIPPANCSLTITPNLGQFFSTIFDISVNNCFDTD